MFEGQPMPDPEPEMNFEDLFKKPHEIAKRVRKLRDEFQNERIQIERREDILKEYKGLKAERDDLKMVLSKYLDESYEDIKIPLSKAKELMEEAERDMKHAEVFKKDDEFREARENWYEVYDFVRLIERDENTLKDAELINED